MSSYTHDTVPSESVPLPENDTAPPGLTVTLPAGFVIVATGAWFGTELTTSVTLAVRVTEPLVPRITSG